MSGFWKEGDEFEVLASLFSDPEVDRDTYTWGNDDVVVPRAGMRGRVERGNDDGRSIGVSFDGLEEYHRGTVDGWSVTPKVYRHFRKIPKALHCAQCENECIDIDYLCSTCRSAS